MKYSRPIKFTARVLLLTLTWQLVLPATRSWALTTGPSQPEVQSFEPVGTTDMVDMFSGDFVYNIPLMDVEGYPVNISYHGGVTMEQEASWVGLGWNINPGAINRGVRGVPDDFNGDTLSRDLHIKDEKNIRIGVGGGVELAGAGDPLIGLSIQAGANLNVSNYRGLSCDFDLGAGVNVFRCISAGVNLGVGTQTGASIDYNVGFSVASSQILSKDVAGGVGINIGQGYNTRTGLKDLNFSISARASAGGSSSQMQLIGGSVPIALRNYVPVITNSSEMKSIYGRFKIGSEFFYTYEFGNASAMVSKVHYNDDGSRRSYGYLYMQNASTFDILDFTRDKDGMFNKNMRYLPSGNMTYDVYNVSGQGTSGSFRPFRNDFGTVYDPITTSTGVDWGVAAEAGFGELFEVGSDLHIASTTATSGPWSLYNQRFTSNQSNSIYENVYFKQAGELTGVNEGNNYYTQVKKKDAVTPSESIALTKKGNSQNVRDARGNLMYYFTADEASIPNTGIETTIRSYRDSGFASGPAVNIDTIRRIGSEKLQRKRHQISQIVQLQKDGRRYIYGIPAMNNIQKEATFSVNPANADINRGLVNYSSQDNSKSNEQGVDNYYSASVTPAYAHSYLLTSVLSTDYVDITGDGPTDDDLGSYTRFNYTLKEKDFRWKVPYDSGKAQYNPGFLCDPKDDKGNYVSGSREQWMLHSIETKNYVAEFYTSARQDGLGMSEAITSSGAYDLSPYNSTAPHGKSYRLDSIKLYNKHDRFINQTNAVPIKTVFFKYDYSLCKGIPNRSISDTSNGNGKLTLKAIYTRYGNSDRSIMSPYQFDYGNFNPRYNLAEKDRWGNYKPNNPTFTNYEYPFVDQADTDNNRYASAWSLTKVTLPSGGVIQATYESDDYAYVQDKAAMQMFKVEGLGIDNNYKPWPLLYLPVLGPSLFIYFKRATASENPHLSIKENYLGKMNSILLNFNVNLKDNRYPEQIKAYATPVDAGVCPDNSAYGYVAIMFKVPQKISKNYSALNPVSYVAMNISRYHLPHIILDKQINADDDLISILIGLSPFSFGKLTKIFKNPISQMLEDGNASSANIEKSYMRLLSPGMHKKGGGQRVKSLVFYDAWDQLAGNNEQEANYGKNYDYTVYDEQLKASISSGVASYEPLIGGDENPFRNAIEYTVQQGNDWPPNEPIDLYQETPVGETLFPAGTVGYSKVTVTSKHASEGRSAQGMDVYDFYTAKGFPIQIESTNINSLSNNRFDFFYQENTFTATQGYSFTFNDMHGKPRAVHHYVNKVKGGEPELISYQEYNYKQNGDRLDNNAEVFEPSSGGMMKVTRQLGVEVDMMIDSRQKDEKTETRAINFNTNTVAFAFVTIPVFFMFPYEGSYHNQFQSAVTTKIIQQYGILESVTTYNEGAVTTMTNEVFDPTTGQPVVTSITNEYKEKEYTVNMPAYWSQGNMGPAYENIKYESDMVLKGVDIAGQTAPNYNAKLEFALFNFIPITFHVGDEILLTYKYNSVDYEIYAWVAQIGYIPHYHPGPPARYIFNIVSRYCKNPPPGWASDTTIINNVHVKIYLSARRNQFNESIASYTTLSVPWENISSSYFLKSTTDKTINATTKTFSDNNTGTLPSYVLLNRQLTDTLNQFLIERQGTYRLSEEYAYMKNRNYNGATNRNTGLFSFVSPWTRYIPPPVDTLEHSYVAFQLSNNPYWKKARTVTQWSPWGIELENLDAIGNYSTAAYGYNQNLPVAVASNSPQGSILAEGFEDYNLLQRTIDFMRFNYSPFKNMFGLQTVGGMYSRYNTGSGGGGVTVVDGIAHTGKSCLKIPSSNVSLNGLLDTATIPYININPCKSFKFLPGKKYVVSFWAKPVSPAANATEYTLPTGTGLSMGYVPLGLVLGQFSKASNIIDGWQKMEIAFSVFGNATRVSFVLPANYYVDDIRIHPSDANMKAFVYHPYNQKLMATLDENNFATFYEYDQEGNLVRTKKETEKGIMTVSESRSNNHKAQ